MDLLRILSNQKAEIKAFKSQQLVTRKEESLVNLDSKLAQVVIGVRRSGKSTLCQKMLIESGINFAYVNFDDENLVNLRKEDLDIVMETLYRIYGKFNHLLLDEIQNIDGWPLFVNRLLRQGMHLVVTGSNANLLSGELATHLTGRYHQIVLFPFSFNEYCTAKGIDTSDFTTEAIASRKRALDKYLLHGGFPETINDPDSRMYASFLLDAIVTKDICKRHNIRYKETLRQMTNNILDNFCQEISVSSLASKHQLNSVHTAKSYLSYMSNAFLVDIIPKFSFKSIERMQARKCYAIDNAFISGHEDALSSDSYGWRLENAVAIELRRRTIPLLQDVRYLRIPKSFEVDFVVSDRNKVSELIQVTYNFNNPSTKLYNREIGGLLKGAEKTGCKNLTLILMEGETGSLKVGGLTVNRINAVDWLLQ